VFAPASVSVPLPTLVSPPPVAPEPALHSNPVGPQSLMMPLTVVLRLLLPTVSWFEPRK
jgi:hypothetical protein